MPEPPRGHQPRVLLAPIEVAGQATLSARGLREIGVDAHVFASPHKFTYGEPDFVPRRRPIVLSALSTSVLNHDVFHFQYGLSFLAPAFRLMDVKALRRARKRVVVEFYGSDVRMPTIAARENPYYVPYPGEDDDRAMKSMGSWAEATEGHAIACDHQLDSYLLPYFPHLHYVGQRVDIDRLPPPQPTRDDDRRTVIAHAPSHAPVKGTVHLRRAVSELLEEGADFEYDEIAGVSHQETLERAARADLVVDQLCAGAHGVFAVEAMALGRPVICNLLPAYAATLPADCPIVNSSPDTIKATLASWLQRPRELAERGLASRDYAARNHDIKVVAGRLLEAYRELPPRRRHARGGHFRAG